MDGGRVVYCLGCVEGYVQPAASTKDAEVFYCPRCCEKRPRSVELEEAFRQELVLSTEDNEFFMISFRDILAASLKDVA